MIKFGSNFIKKIASHAEMLLWPWLGPDREFKIRYKIPYYIFTC